MPVSNGDVRIDSYVEAGGKRLSRITHIPTGSIILWNGRISMKNAIAEVERMLASPILPIEEDGK